MRVCVRVWLYFVYGFVCARINKCDRVAFPSRKPINWLFATLARSTSLRNYLKMIAFMKSRRQQNRASISIFIAAGNYVYVYAYNMTNACVIGFLFLFVK